MFWAEYRSREIWAQDEGSAKASESEGPIMKSYAVGQSFSEQQNAPVGQFAASYPVYRLLQHSCWKRKANRHKTNARALHKHVES